LVASIASGEGSAALGRGALVACKGKANKLNNRVQLKK